MKPITVSTTVAKPREEVFEYLDLLANHEQYLGHMYLHWTFTGPAHGVGAKARARVSAPGSREFAEFVVLESERPQRIVEETISSNGKRRTRGTYRLDPLPHGGTQVTLELAWVEVPRSERIFPPLSRRFLARALGKGMRRLRKQLEAQH
ncbi:MAG: SRPBCC family protein [Solirubrobacterales bacterium]|nr:SRPBCC family protein [Solirubrobacterales bacterium]